MEANKKELTEHDLIELLMVKIKEPDLQLKDIYKGINNIHPPITKKLTTNIIPPLLLDLVFLGIIIFNTDKSWNRVGLIGYILSGLWITYNFKRFVGEVWQPLLILFIIMYIASSTTYDIKEILDLAKSVLL